MSLFSRLARVAVPAIAFAVATAANADNQADQARHHERPRCANLEVVQKVAKKDGWTSRSSSSTITPSPTPHWIRATWMPTASSISPLLDGQIKARGYKIVNVGLTYVAPMGFYSKKIKSLAQLKEGAKVGNQNDPSNGNRALLLLQKAGVIKLKAGAGTNGNNATTA